MKLEDLLKEIMPRSIHSTIDNAEFALANKLENYKNLYDYIMSQSRVIEAYYKGYMLACCIDDKEQRIKLMQKIKNALTDLPQSLRELRDIIKDKKDILEKGCASKK
jgi:hypothetical protein